MRGNNTLDETDAPETTELTQRAKGRISREQLAWLVAAFLVGVAAGALIITLSGRSSASPVIIATRPPESSPEITASPEPTRPPAPIKVFVSGEVANPAVYELPAGAIIQDLVRSAGGFTESAEQDVVNLALTLSDGMHIHVPGVEEEISIPVVSGGAGSGGLLEDGTVNINLATLQELETLPGIGPSLAQAIIDYREQNGVFGQTEEILEVPGIGPAKYESLKDLIAVN